MLRGDPDGIEALLAANVDLPDASSGHPSGPLRRYPDQATHEAGVRRCQEHIRAGDVFQIVLAQRAERPTSATALEIYRALRRINPSPYMFLLELGEYALVGSSPETHVKLEGTRASLNPIAGTTAAGDGDAELLLGSEKDRAEHVMLVDLGRNDLSRVCRPGSVHVERFLQVERFSHVTHLVSEVAGELRDGVGAWDLLRATFPAGTVSGAPKVRAMQIISELEGYRRGFYAGVVGYHIPGVGLDTCIALRTLLLSEGVAYLQAGGGVVADSDPAAEHQECLNKLGAVERAVELAEGSCRLLMLLLIDNYDSFTYNLAHLFGELGVEVVVRRNDEITVAEAEQLAPSHVVISPGPGRPENAGVSEEIVRRVRRSRAGARRLPRASGDRRGLRRRDRAGTLARARQGHEREPRRARHLRGAPGGVRRGALSLARGDVRARVPRGLRHVRRRRGDGRAPPRAARRRRPVPSGVGADP